MQVAKQRDAGKRPVALDGAERDFEDAGDLVKLEAAEVAELNDAGLAGIVGGKPSKGFTDGGSFVEAVGGDGEVIIHLHAMQAACAPSGIMLPGIVDENLAHDVSGESDELSAAAPVDVFTGEAEICFVDQRGGLQGVVGALAAHIGLSEAVKLSVHEWKQPVGRSGVAGVHGFEKAGNLAGN
jgi:hypothetical protein